MKHKLLLITVIVMVISCSTDETQVKPSEKGLFKTGTVSSVTKTKISDFLIEQRINGKSFRAQFGVDFDLANLQSVTMRGSNVNSYVANQIGYDKNNTVNYGLGFIEKDGIIVGAMIVKMNVLNNDKKQIDYFNVKSELIFSTVIDVANESVNFISGSNASGRKAEAEGCGDKTIDCIKSVYEDHGWFSVALAIATAYDPLIGVGIAAGCAAGCLADSV